MKKKGVRINGMTLIEVTVASVLLFIISGTIALALSTVFDGYIITQQAGGVEQDAQLILSRIRFASGNHNDGVILSDSKKESFLRAGSTFTNVKIDESEPTRLVLDEGSLQGEYISATKTLGEAQKITRLFVVGNSATTSATLRAQIAANTKTGGVCVDSTNFVGPDKTASTFFVGAIQDIQESSSGIFINPAECVRYKIFFERQSANIESPSVFEIRLEK